MKDMDRISELENKVIDLEKRLKKLEENQPKSNISENNIVLSSSTISEEKLINKIDDISTQHLTVIVLRIYKELTKTEIQQKLRMWGANFGNWFQGGNLNNRLINKSILVVIRKNADDEDVYSLSKKGETLADGYINKYELHV